MMYDALGLGWGNTLLAFIALGLIPVIWIFLKYGKGLEHILDSGWTFSIAIRDQFSVIARMLCIKTQDRLTLLTRLRCEMLGFESYKESSVEQTNERTKLNSTILMPNMHEITDINQVRLMP
ncbi:hypothetical protein V1517DRAFT_46624 [Lipomyces orientalis]|uniref:Uncharacterized protein n=1 Tax=Lipomyces orientalis TaxID=1233043 RepID=A0ACC3TER7_9ASCO